MSAAKTVDDNKQTKRTNVLLMKTTKVGRCGFATIMSVHLKKSISHEAVAVSRCRYQSSFVVSFMTGGIVIWAGEAVVKAA